MLPRLLATAALFLSMLSCSENLDSSGVCPVLCPQIGGEVQNVTLNGAISLDTTVQSLAGLGTEPNLFLASRGDTLDTRVVLRFDSLPQKFVPVGDTAKPITSVDSAYILLRLDTLHIKAGAPVTIEAYDVDTTANDTSTAAILALFRPDRFISSQTFAATDLKDSVKYFISNAAVLAKIQNNQRLRIGLRSTGILSSQIVIKATEIGTPPIMFFRAIPDTTTKPLQVGLLSKTPADPILAINLRDYTVIAKAPPAAPPSVLALGGLPTRRIYVRFVVPDSIIDSATVVRATLLLNQIQNAALDPTDTVKVLPQVVLAGTVVTDPAKAAQIIGNISTDTLRLRPGDAGIVSVDLVGAIALWRAQPPDSLPRAIVLKPVFEGSSPLEIRFSSTEEAVAALRPQLRLSYTRKVPLGLP
jgi:hypothetical protein